MQGCVCFNNAPSRVTAAGLVLASDTTSTQALSGGTLTWRPLLRWGLEELKSSAAQVAEARGKSGQRCHLPLSGVCQRWAPTCVTALHTAGGGPEGAGSGTLGTSHRGLVGLCMIGLWRKALWAL